MGIVIVPNVLRDSIYEKVDEQLTLQPQLRKHREEIYHELLQYYYDNGTIPDFKLKNKELNNES